MTPMQGVRHRSITTQDAPFLSTQALMDSIGEISIVTDWQENWRWDKIEGLGSRPCYGCGRYQTSTEVIAPVLRTVPEARASLHF